MLRFFLFSVIHNYIMALFQQSVIKKYISDLNKEDVQKAWALFQSHFHNAAIQENIRDAKEEEYQEGFVRDIFVNILGYTLKPQPHYNFVLEKKTETDATKSDGALLRDDNIIGVVELKDTGTTELDKIEKQVFGYKHKHKNCVYAITSNFEKLRFYINDSTDFEEFNLFALTEERFTVLYLCLYQQSIQNDVPLKMKQVSISEEENVTKKLYADYSSFKKELFNSIATLNPQYNKLELFKKTQKLLDRLLFILFAEDRGLLPPNSVREILNQWQQLKELDNYVSLYSRFIKYFGYLNTGHTGKQYDIFAYNGGLFAPDDILDNIKIEDNLLHKGGLTLSKYDFDSEVDVNILGHIFEHSLGEIEEVQAQLEGATVDKTKTKRKKDGVFYTPRYITKYMVENTVGALCNQQKQTMGIQDDAFTPQKRKANTKQLKQKLDDYRQWLLHITICDPACGSGAFLNQALEFLIAEHRLIDELTAKLFGDAMVLSDVENTILENNIFGVDINDEAVEIARLSLWLRTARKGRKLNNLSSNIKCGNSLIDDPAVAGDKAFNWQKEFPQIFGEYISNKQKPATATESKQKHTATEPTTYINQEEDEATERNREQITNDDNSVVNTDFKIVNEPIAEYGNEKQVKWGFDVVIGNPPWGARLDNESLSFLVNKFPIVPTKLKDTYMYFMLMSLVLINKAGYLGFIVPNTWLLINNTADFRKYFLNLDLLQIIDHGDGVFDDAIVESSTIILKNRLANYGNILAAKYRGGVEVINHIINKQIWLDEELHRIVIELTQVSYSIIRKMECSSKPFEKSSEIIFGIKPYQVGHGIPPQTREMVDARIYHSTKSENEEWFPLVTGTDVNKYSLIFSGSEYIQYGKWLMYASNENKIKSKKILLRRTSDDLRAVVDSECYYPQNSLFIITSSYDLNFLSSLLNSKLFDFIYKAKCPQVGKVFAEVKPSIIKSLPIADIDDQQQLPFIAKADIMLSKNKELQQVKQQLQQLLLGKYSGLKLNNKLTNWPALNFADFLKELTKQKIKISLPEEAEWLTYFEQQKVIANNIEQVINTTDKEIDKMVYALYELTEEEKRIVEGTV